MFSILMFIVTMTAVMFFIQYFPKVSILIFVVGAIFILYVGYEIEHDGELRENAPLTSTQIIDYEEQIDRNWEPPKHCNFKKYPYYIADFNPKTYLSVSNDDCQPPSTHLRELYTQSLDYTNVVSKCVILSNRGDLYDRSIFINCIGWNKMLKKYATQQ